MTIKINFMSAKDNNEKRLMHSKSDNREIRICIDAEEAIEELFNWLLHKYQVGLKELMKGSNFVSDYVDRLFCK